MQRTYSLSSPLRRALSITLVALACAPSVHADSRYLEPQASAPVDALRVVQGRDGSFWSFDGEAIRHTAANGQTTTLQRRSSLPLGDTTVYVDGIVTADGGLVAYSSDCQLLRVSGDLRTTWREPQHAFPCKAVDANAQGISWTGGPLPGDGDNFHQYGPDGLQRLRMRIGGDGVLFTFEDLISFKALADDGLIALSRGIATRKAMLTRYRTSAREWHWEGDPETVQAFEVGADGSVWGVGVVGGSLWATRLNAQGTLLYSRRSANADSAVLALKKAPGDALYAITGSATVPTQPRTLVRLSADGTLAWQQPLCPGAGAGAEPGPVDIAVGPDGSVANLCATTAQDRLVRRGSDGTIAAEIALPFDRALQLQADAAGTLLVLGREQPEAPYRTRLIALDASNQIRDTALNGLVGLAPTSLVAGLVDRDGASYLVTQDGTAAPRYGVSKIGTDGRRAWRREIPGLNLRSAQLQAGHGRVCVSVSTGSSVQPSSAEKQIAFCLDAGDGTPYGTQEETTPGSGTQLRIRPLANGQSLLLRLTALDYTIVVQNAAGAVRTTRGEGRALRSDIDADGRVTLAIGERVVRHAADGSIAYTVAQAPVVSYASEFATAADGSAYIAGQARGQAASQRTLWAIAPDGATRWAKPLPLTDADSQLLVASDAVYALQSYAVASDTVRNRLSRIELASGDERWSYDISSTGNQRLRQALSVNGNGVLVAQVVGNRLNLQRVGATSRRTDHERNVFCGDACAALTDFATTDDGTARAIIPVADRANGQTAAVLKLDHAADDAPHIPVGQPGVTGLWHAPYTNGQGISIDWLPDSNTLFAAWFTYDWGSGFSSRRALRWYTLQVNGVPAGVTELELPILNTVGGNFAAGPAVSPAAQPAGKAWLSFSDCNNATLRYDLFDPTGTGFGHGRANVITLSRVTPATQPCRLADGSSQPGAGTRPPSQGFDARLSGAWYDAASVGQGLQLNVQPGGVFFAPWFTYDPADVPASQSRRHWFTLQGNLAQARDGRVDVQIVQTTGGGFDFLPTYNANVVGIATLTVLACDRATLDYRFTDPLIAGPFAELSGRLALTRMGGCAP